MICKFWHLKPWPSELRSKIELIEWPFYHSDYGPLPSKLQAYLQELSVVRLEVQGKASKLIVPLKEPGIYPSVNADEWTEPFDCYKSTGDFDENDWTILFWNPRRPDFKRYVGKVPDNAAWLEWNAKARVRKMDSSAVWYG